MSKVARSIADEVNQLADEYRDECLWFLRREFYPGTDAERWQILEHIMRHGDRRAFRRAAEVRRWLSASVRYLTSASGDRDPRGGPAQPVRVWEAVAAMSVEEEEPMPATVASHSDLDALLDLNRDYIRSVEASDVRRFTEILADDFLCSNPDGSLVDREGFLKQTARPSGISNLETHDVKVRILGDVAIIHARTTYRKPDGTTGAGRYTDVWARREGHWLAVSAHVTRC
jgi:ketosteroid isomerase-like protein